MIPPLLGKSVKWRVESGKWKVMITSTYACQSFKGSICREITPYIIYTRARGRHIHLST